MKLFPLLFVFLTACPPVPVPPVPDASDATAPAPLDAAPPAAQDAAPVFLDAAVTVLDAAPKKVDAMAGDLGTQVCDHLTAIGCRQPATCPNQVNTKQGVF